MKKIIVSVMVLVASYSTTFALSPSSDYNAFYKLNDKAAFTGLMNYIDADKEQSDYLKHVFEVTANELKSAVKKENEVAVESVLNYNFHNTKCILSADQYKKYLIFINVYLTNENNYTSLSKN